MFAAVGYQGITAAQIATRLTEKIRKQRQQEQDLEQTLAEYNRNQNANEEWQKRLGRSCRRCRQSTCPSF